MRKDAKYTDDCPRQLRVMVAAGCSSKQIPINFGVSRGSIYHWCRNYPAFSAMYDRLRDQIRDNSHRYSDQFPPPPLYDTDELLAALAINGAISCRIIKMGLDHYGASSNKTNS